VRNSVGKVVMGKISEAGVRRRAEHYCQQLDVLRPLRLEARRDFTGWRCRLIAPFLS
jgi:hypothetical protein